MAPKYEIGQRIIITPVKSQHFTARDADLERYAGQSGEITDCHWITATVGEAFYIYTVQVGDKEIVLHEDELEAYIP